MTAPPTDNARNSLRQCILISDIVAELFFDRLFEIDPACKASFHHDARNRQRHWTEAFASAVDQLPNEPMNIGNDFSSSSESVREALIFAVELAFGVSFEEEERLVWSYLGEDLAASLPEPAHTAAA